MFCLRSAEAFLRSRSVLLAAVIASVSSIALSQDSFMAESLGLPAFVYACAVRPASRDAISG